eukprot:gb/GEZN01012155.1/.p1 GENE.gb/GEZN01012155.1/~~gb/GEZN01012155.1/.p1  ORF type:complete len:141 (+),score=9.98 gb/GEZN01012155.1/:186-608(+)
MLRWGRGNPREGLDWSIFPRLLFPLPPSRGGGYGGGGYGAGGGGGGPSRPMSGPPGSRASQGNKKPKPCEFFPTERGCVKGDACDFIHRKAKPCSYFGQPRGCAKGDYCDFQHDAGAEGAGAEAGKAPSAHESGVRYKPY